MNKTKAAKCGEMFDTLIPLDCDVQHYPWGGRAAAGGVLPFIAELTGRQAVADQPFAELWIGAHPSLPSRARTGRGEMPLDRFIGDFPEEILGPAVLAAGFHSLPFLLKILDCDQPLSIQAHPDLERAARLHARDPDHYPDANHKPEIAIGISGMTAFCQFRPAAEIANDLARIPALTAFFAAVDGGEAPGGKAWLRGLYRHIFSAGDEAVAGVLEGVREWIRQHGAARSADEWFLRLHEFHPGDRGMLSAYFLNILHLGPGEAVFLGPNEPHAYLSGTIVECMASSDNVVRAGLTPKFIDRDVLVEMITCETGAPQTDPGEMVHPGEKVYRVPVPEFQVEIYSHDADVVRDYSAHGAVSLLLILEGRALFDTAHGEIEAARGSAWLWPAALESVRVRYLGNGTKIIRACPNMQMLAGVGCDR